MTSIRGIKIDEETKRKCIQKAKELAAEYQGTLVGCGHCSFAAIIDALKSVGIRLIPEEVEEKAFSGLMGLTGGVGNMGLGACGALIGASFCVSLATGVTRKENETDKDNRWLAYYDVKKYMCEKFLERWGALTCREIQMKNFGRAYNSRIPERSKELFEMANKKGCRNPEQCTISLAAGWATEAILEILERTQEEREKLKREIIATYAKDTKVALKE